MNVTVITPVRDAIRHLRSYELRMLGASMGQHKLDVIFVEGDSVDGTYDAVSEMSRRSSLFSVVKHDTLTAKYGSVVHPIRFEALASVFNRGIDEADLDWSDYVKLLPVDISWHVSIIDRLVAHNVDVVSPFVFMDSLFYDTWAFSFDGTYFPPFRINEPQPWLRISENGLIPLTTAGGTMMFKSSVVNAGIRYSPVDVDRGFTTAARSSGFGVWGDPNLHVFHTR